MMESSAKFEERFHEEIAQHLEARGPRMRVQTDYELMELVMSKHRPALEELYDRHVKLVYSFAVKATRNEQMAREIVQLVFLRLWTTAKGYDPAKGLFVNWLLTITRNLTVDHLRKERRQPSVSFEQEHWELLTDSFERGPEALVTRKITRDEIREAYKILSSSQIRLIEYVYWEGYTLSEVADLEREPLGTIKSRLHQSLKLLRTSMQAQREG